MGKKALFCLFFIVLFSLFIGNVSGETVFVYIEQGDIVLKQGIHDNSALWITRIEDGIMDILFDNGHIVFSNDSGRNQIKDFEVLNQLAKSGGAEILVSAVLNLRINDDKMVISGEYKIYDLFTDDIIYTNKYVFDNALQKSSQGIEEKLFLAGQNVGKQIKSTL